MWRGALVFRSPVACRQRAVGNALDDGYVQSIQLRTAGKNVARKSKSVDLSQLSAACITAQLQSFLINSHITLMLCRPHRHLGPDMVDQPQLCGNHNRSSSDTRWTTIQGQASFRVRTVRIRASSLLFRRPNLTVRSGADSRTD
jgi:hypothetical protein